MNKTSNVVAITLVTTLALLFPTLGWAEESAVDPSEDLLLASAILTGNWSLMADNGALEDVEIDNDKHERVKLGTWVSWAGTYDGEDEGALSNSRLRADVSLPGGFSATWEHDFQNHFNGRGFDRPSEDDMTYAYLKWSKGLAKGGKVTFVGGQYLDSVAYAYPSPASLPTTSYPVTINGYGIYSRGAAVWIEGTSATFRVNYDTKDERVATSVFVGPVSLYWDNRHGFGLIAEHSFGRWANLELGLDKHEVEKEPWQERVFLQYHADISETLRAYARWDKNFQQDETSWLGGITWEYLPVSFVKLYWEESSDGGNLAAQVTLSQTF